jgi:hypothetical protein
MKNFDIFRAVRVSEFSLQCSHFLYAEEDMFLAEEMSADGRGGADLAAFHLSGRGACAP